MNIRAQIIEAIGDRLAQISTQNGYSTDWSRLNYWQSQPTEYRENYLLYSDEEESYKRINRQHEARLPIEIAAIIFDAEAASLGTMALRDLIKAVGVDPSWGGLAIDTELIRSNKFCQTQGSLVCEARLEIAIIYRFPLFDLGV